MLCLREGRDEATRSCTSSPLKLWLRGLFRHRRHPVPREQKLESISEHFSGTTDVYDAGTRLGRVHYTIEVTHERVMSARGGYELGARRVAGRIAAAEGHPADLMFQLMNYEQLRLQLDDGRWWHFRVTSASGATVNVSGRFSAA